MKVFLLHEDRDFAVKPGLRDAIFDAMASGDLFALTSARRDLQRARSSGPVAAAPGNDDVLTQDLELQTLSSTRWNDGGMCRATGGWARWPRPPCSATATGSWWR